MVRELADACRGRGLRFGVYLSPWDRNHPDYGRPAYLTYYRNQLEELTSEYGELFEVWFDGANGGDGYYGGARETRTIDRKTYYDWEPTWDIVRRNQPGAVMFSDAGPDIRWIGNERGVAGDPCWATLTRDGLYPGMDDPSGTSRELLNHGDPEGSHWLPGECDVSIRPGWFYHASEDSSVRSPDNLFDIYLQSVGRGANLLLNLPPDRRGRIHETDATSLAGFRRRRDRLFARNLAAGAAVTTSSTRAGGLAFAPANLIDGDRDTYWMPDVAGTAQVVIDFGRDVTFTTVRIREVIALGQRVRGFAIDVDRDGWTQIAAGQSIGARRICHGGRMQTRRVRVRITASAAPVALNEVGIYLDDRG